LVFDIYWVNKFKTIEANHLSKTPNREALLFCGTGTHPADKQKPSDASK